MNIQTELVLKEIYQLEEQSKTRLACQTLFYYTETNFRLDQFHLVDDLIKNLDLSKVSVLLIESSIRGLNKAKERLSYWTEYCNKIKQLSNSVCFPDRALILLENQKESHV